MLLKGLLIATEKLVPFSHLHLRPILWLKNNCHVSGIPGKGNSCTQVCPSSVRAVATGKKQASRPTFATLQDAVQIFTDTSTRRCSLRELYGKMNLVSSRKQSANNIAGTKGCSTGPQEVREPVLGPDYSGNTTVVFYINKREVWDQYTNKAV